MNAALPVNSDLRCGFVYCRAWLGAHKRVCEICGYSGGADTEASLAAVASLFPGAKIDMHQIIRSGPEALARQLAAMDRLGIGRALIQSVPDAAAALIWGNEKLLQLSEAHPDRFWISQHLDPRDSDSEAKLRAWAGRRVRVVKLLPCLGYDPADPRFDAVWALMEKLGMIAFVHTGFITARMKREEKARGIFLSSEFCRPIYWDRIARQFPELQIILCHMGGALWFEEAAVMTYEHDNVWADISGPGLLGLRQALQRGIPVHPRKLFWGNDGSVDQYSLCLRLLHATLRSAGMEGMGERLIYRNALEFSDRFLQ